MSVGQAKRTEALSFAPAPDPSGRSQAVGTLATHAPSKAVIEDVP